MKDETLTGAELQALTGQKTLTKRMLWLARRGIPFRYGGKEIAVVRAVASELPQWRDVQPKGPRLDLVR